MILERTCHSKCQCILPHLIFQEKIQSKHHKKYCKYIILTEDKLAEHTHWKYKKRKFAQERFFLPESHLLTNMVDNLCSNKINDHRQKLVPHQIDKAVRKDCLRSMARQIKRQVPDRIGDKGTWQIIRPVTA